MTSASETSAARTQSCYEARSYNEMGFWYYLGLSALILAAFALPVLYEIRP